MPGTNNRFRFRVRFMSTKVVSRPSFSGAPLGGASKISGTRQEVKTFEFRLSTHASLLLHRFGCLLVHDSRHHRARKSDSYRD